MRIAWSKSPQPVTSTQSTAYVAKQRAEPNFPLPIFQLSFFSLPLSAALISTTQLSRRQQWRSLDVESGDFGNMSPTFRPRATGMMSTVLGNWKCGRVSWIWYTYIKWFMVCHWWNWKLSLKWIMPAKLVDLIGNWKSNKLLEQSGIYNIVQTI